MFDLPLAAVHGNHFPFGDRTASDRHPSQRKLTNINLYMEVVKAGKYNQSSNEKLTNINLQVEFPSVLLCVPVSMSNVLIFSTLKTV